MGNTRIAAKQWRLVLVRQKFFVYLLKIILWQGGGGAYPPNFLSKFFLSFAMGRSLPPWDRPCPVLQDFGLVFMAYFLLEIVKFCVQ